MSLKDVIAAGKIGTDIQTLVGQMASIANLWTGPNGPLPTALDDSSLILTLDSKQADPLMEQLFALIAKPTVQNVVDASKGLFDADAANTAGLALALAQLITYAHGYVAARLPVNDV